MRNQRRSRVPAHMARRTAMSVLLLLGACGSVASPPASTELDDVRTTALGVRERWSSTAVQAGLDQDPVGDRIVASYRKAAAEADNGDTRRAIQSYTRAADLARDATALASAVANDSMTRALVYRNDYPDGVFKVRVDETLWAMATERNTSSAYALYLAAGPNGAYVNDAAHGRHALGTEQRAAMRRIASAETAARESEPSRGFEKIHLPPRETALPEPARKVRETMDRIVAERDLPSLMNLLADDVQVSLGGMEGRADFTRYWNLHTAAKKTPLWGVLESLTRHPPAYSAGDAGRAPRLVWPYYFSEWPRQRNAFDYLFAPARELPIRAEASHAAKVVRRVSFEAVRIQNQDRSCMPSRCDWVFVQASDGLTGYVSPGNGWRAIVGYRLIARRENKAWYISALIAGD